ncbi:MULTISPECIES: type II toxin-antitoxin system Phd/YefM family antitoxin [Amphritea]|uniref:Antitoxin n=2 Tax=Amphritea TaxID=515417 RepID=A0A1H9GHU2_9GAMM|nr:MULTISPECIES: type II toxin-antitoxin system prevent-host-death family antitoxin [Amphritea]MBN0987612.1 type II toxin-antitoxin system prevent-host-death family antitoxin [Amphritea pacifica]MBN1007457.1 type II toxin-antitoxin system prevent-host-death family antitoxin [Amphritea pacifica]SEQ49599.1 antitoxin YefM [Amphritea atlantica]
MNIVNYSDARASLKSVMDATCDSHEATVITRKNGGDVVMLSKEDYDSINETLYLLRSPRNAERLLNAVADIKAGRVVVHDLQDIENGEEIELGK